MLTKKELSKTLGIAISTIDKHMKEGLPYRKFGKSVRFDVLEVMDWYAEEAKKNKES